MEERGEITALDVAEAFTGWWELAGLDAAVSETAVNWIADDAPVTTSKATAKIATDTRIADQSATLAIEWPTDISVLREMVTGGAPLPGNSFGPRRIAPSGPANGNCMIISDIPDITEEPGSPASVIGNALLLRRMLAAIGMSISDCYCTWLATSVPSTGEVPEHALPELTAFMLHQIKLVAPASVLILGSTACTALLDAELLDARKALRNINHNGLSIPALVTIHPRTLIARPAMKAQAWNDLQMFLQRAAQ